MIKQLATSSTRRAYNTLHIVNRTRKKLNITSDNYYINKNNQKLSTSTDY